MKRVTKIFVSVLAIMCFGFVLSACKPKIESAHVKNGTLETTIAKGEELDTSKTIVIVDYSDSSSKEVESKDLVFGQIDVNVLGTQQLKISYGDYSFEVPIKVVATEADVSTITSLNSRLLNEFNANKDVQSADSKGLEFVDRTQILRVGDDNPFNFRLFASGIDGAGVRRTNITRVRTNIKVEQKDDQTYNELTGEALNNIVDIDTVNTTLDFKETAIGKKFRVTVSADNVDADYLEEGGATTSFSTELEVVDGYNVYNAKDLSLYDNVHDSYNSIRPTDQPVKALILQDNIVITKDDVRKDAFWSESSPNYRNDLNNLTDQTVIGSPIDNSEDGIYHRTLADGETFDFVGNYFTIDAKSFPKMVLEFTNPTNGVNVKESDYMTAHLSLFYNDALASNPNASTVNWSNIHFVGNGELNAQPENSGAIILSKAKVVNFNATNNITHYFYITNFFTYEEDLRADQGNNVLLNCKAFQSYQTLIYTWGVKSLKIVNCELRDAGGPVMIVDHCKQDDNDTTGTTGYTSSIDIINSNLESKVTGKEPWFTVYGAGELFGQLAMADQLFTGIDPQGKPNNLPQNDVTMTAGYANDNGNMVPKVNLVAVMKSGSNQGLSSKRIKGYIRVFDSQSDYDKYYDSKNPQITTYGLDMSNSTVVDRVFNDPTGSIYFESNKSGGYINSNVGINSDVTMQSDKKVNELYAGIAAGMQKAGFTVAPTQEQFASLDFEQKKGAIAHMIQGIGSISGLPEANKIGFLDQIYESAKNGAFKEILEWDNTLTKSAIDNEITRLTALKAKTSNKEEIAKIEARIDQLEKLQPATEDQANVNEKVRLLTNAVASIKPDASYADGKYSNIYIFNGMGVMVQMYPKTKA